VKGPTSGPVLMLEQHVLAEATPTIRAAQLGAVRVVAVGAGATGALAIGRLAIGRTVVRQLKNRDLEGKPCMSTAPGRPSANRDQTR
jgi:hypothetical protein